MGRGEKRRGLGWGRRIEEEWLQSGKGRESKSGQWRRMDR